MRPPELDGSVAQDAALTKNLLGSLGRAFKTLPVAAHSVAAADAPKDVPSRYERVAELGRGGWGIVERAVDLQLQREVAVKRTVSKNASPEQIAKQFLHEAKITSQLQHPGIVPIHELGNTESGESFYVMKLLEGGTFRDQIHHQHSLVKNPSKPPAASELNAIILPLLNRFVDICNAIAFAHNRGVIHRDLKPANIMAGDFGETIVLDWGLAKQVDLETSESSHAQSGEPNGAIVGTPAYMAPEQAKGDTARIGKHSDIYALGAMLYEVVAGRHPHDGQGIDQVLARVREGRYDSLKSVQPAAPKALIAIVETAMAYQPNQRYRSAEVLADDVRKYISGEHVSVHIESILDQISRWCRHHRQTTVSIAASLLIMLIASTVFGVVIKRAHRFEQLARLEAQAAHAAAVRQLVETRDVTDSWLIDLTGSIEFYPGNHPLRAQYLARAIEQYERLVSAPIEYPPASKDQHKSLQMLSKHERAKCLIRLGNLYRLNNQLELSERKLDAATSLLNELAGAFPNGDSSDAGDRITNVAFSQAIDAQSNTKDELDLQPASFGEQIRLEQINTLIGSSYFQNFRYDSSQWESSRKWLTSKLIELRSTVGDKPNDIAYKLASAIVRLELALHNDHLQAASSIENMTRAAQAARWLADARGHWSDQQLSQTAQTSLATWHEERGQFPQAEEAWTMLIHDLERWSAVQQHRSDQLQSMGQARLRRAECRLHTPGTSEVENDLRQAIVDLNAAWQLTDGDAFFRTNLATAQLRLASLQDEEDSAAQQESLRLMQSAQRIYESLSKENPNAGTIRPLARINVVIADLKLRLGRQDVLENLEAALFGFQWLFDNQEMVARDLELWGKSIAMTSRQTLSNAQRVLLQRARLCEQQFSKADASAERTSEIPTSAVSASK